MHKSSLVTEHVSVTLPYFSCDASFFTADGFRGRQLIDVVFHVTNEIDGLMGARALRLSRACIPTRIETAVRRQIALELQRRILVALMDEYDSR
jgi:hypothetical protein